MTNFSIIFQQRVKSDSDFSSDDDSSPIIARRLTRNSTQIRILISDSESDESDIIVPRRVRNLAPLILSDSDDSWESDFSDSDEVKMQAVELLKLIFYF